jgi:hypothetical protein
VAAAGDINGDTFGDVVIGAPTFANGEVAEGRIYVFLGSATLTAPGPLGAAPSYTYESNLANAQLGSSVTAAGDTNGDGKLDIAAGAAGYTQGVGQDGEGAVYGFRGDGATVAFFAVHDSNAAGAQLGYSISSADIDGDGKTDIVAGAPGYAGGQLNEGAVYLFRGGAAGLGVPSVYESNVLGALLGEALSATGNINGAAGPDVAAGAPGYGNGQAGEGAAYIFLGDPAGLLPPTIVERDQAGAALGKAVAIVGDANADGKADVVIGADSFDTATANVGAAFLFLGTATGVGPGPFWQAVGNQADDEFGFAVAGADVNNDTRADVVVGAYRYDAPQGDEGRIYQYLGLAPPAKPSAPHGLDRVPSVLPDVRTQLASAWVRDGGVAVGEIATFDDAGTHCSLRGYLSVVGLECTVDGVKLAPAFGALGSLAKSDRAWHQVSVAFRGGSAELLIDGKASDRTGTARRTLMTARSLTVARGTGGYAIDSLRLRSL